MPKVRKVPYNANHLDYMSSWHEAGLPIDPPPEFVFELRISDTTLVFKDKDQLREARDFFALKLRPPSAGLNPPWEHYWHPWFARLPKVVTKRTNREKILRALKRAIEDTKL